MKKKMFLAVSIASAIALLAGGCGIKESMTINPDLSANVTAEIYWTPEEVKTLGMNTDDLQKKEVDGKTYYVSTDSEKASDKETKSAFVALTKSKMEMSTATESVNSTSTIEMTPEEMMAVKESMPFATISITLPKPVLASNGAISDDKKTITYDLMTLKPNTRIYAAMSKQAKTSKKITVSGVKNNGFYRQSKTVKVSSPGVITSLRVNGKETEKNSYKASANKKYTVKIKLLSGATKTVKFTVDKQKPTVNVKNKTYKKRVTLKFSDKLSGIKKATLNGKAVKNKEVVKKKGKYTLKVTDKAGNVKTVKFTIK